ncbi:TetR/AcrR family transcriptional regulator [Salinibacterium sp. SYSU T00001]|uniref:TetR/AcrR family transcriptional regulator n=1 Tax=Homoserinimonas sedimenticola TaxID=2986805 RepID=UPI002236A165|nr:TetR/AcrR family transcriptional regulator [Salinibacterium sedimenticola]MCW4386422.1 TetR/AcrR family transcriptional regulator [Salinibacterium sedimenticola]
MSRPTDPDRKPALLEQIVEYLLDEPLSSVSLRPLAQALGVSTFTLVYHFGSRAELINEIVRSLSQRSLAIARRLEQTPVTILTYQESMETSWAWAIQPRSILLLRLEFEAALLESREGSHRFSREIYARWQQIGQDALIDLGLNPAAAEAESRLTVDTIFGLQYDLVVNQDADAATRAFRLFAEQSRERIERMLSAR